MANSMQARKRIRQSRKANTANTARRTRVRTAMKKFDTALTAGDKTAIGTTFQAAMSELHRGVSKGILKKATAARRISRMAADIRRSAAK